MRKRSRKTPPECHHSQESLKNRCQVGLPLHLSDNQVSCTSNLLRRLRQRSLLLRTASSREKLCRLRTQTRKVQHHQKPNNPFPIQSELPFPIRQMDGAATATNPQLKGMPKLSGYHPRVRLRRKSPSSRLSQQRLDLRLRMHLWKVNQRSKPFTRRRRNTALKLTLQILKTRRHPLLQRSWTRASHHWIQGVLGIDSQNHGKSHP